MKNKILVTALARALSLADASAQPWITSTLPSVLVAWWQVEGELLDSAGPHTGTGNTDH